MTSSPSITPHPTGAGPAPDHPIAEAEAAWTRRLRACGRRRAAVRGRGRGPGADPARVQPDPQRAQPARRRQPGLDPGRQLHRHRAAAHRAPPQCAARSPRARAAGGRPGCWPLPGRAHRGRDIPPRPQRRVPARHPAGRQRHLQLARRAARGERQRRVPRADHLLLRAARRYRASGHAHGGLLGRRRGVRGGGRHRRRSARLAHPVRRRVHRPAVDRGRSHGSRPPEAATRPYRPHQERPGWAPSTQGKTSPS